MIRVWLLALLIFSTVADECVVVTPLIAAPVPQVVCVGDSITYGQNSGDDGNTTSYPYALAQSLGYAYDLVVHNMGVTGLGTADLPDVDYLLRPYGPNHLILEIGVNDLSHTADSAATIYARRQAYATARQAAGWTVTDCTVTVIGTADAGINARRTAYNTLIRSGSSRLVDLAANAHIGDGATTPSTWVTSDLVHLTATGNALAASIIFTFLNANLTAPPISRTVAMGLERSTTLTAWFRDWNSIVPQLRSVDAMHSLSNARAFQNYLTQNDDGDVSPHVPPNKVDAAMNGYPIVRMPGDGIDTLAYFSSLATTLSQVIGASSWLVHFVVNITSIDTNQASPYFNACLVSDVGAQWGVALTNNVGTLSATAFVNDGAVKSVSVPVTTGGAQVISFRATGGKIGIRIGTTGSWAENTAGAVADLTNHIRMGVGTIIIHTLHGDVAEHAYRNTYVAYEDVADCAYFRARYGVL